MSTPASVPAEIFPGPVGSTPALTGRGGLESFGSRWGKECFGAATALTLALVAVWHVAASDRAWLLFYSGDSVLLELVRKSIEAGQPQHWAFSAVLFLPEMALYFTIAALGFSIKATFVLSAIANFLLLYSGLRLVSVLLGSQHSRSRQILGSLGAFAAIVVLSLLDSSERTDSLELTSLLATTTYYSMTVLALFVATGLSAALLQRRGRGRLLIISLFSLSALSALSNPLYLVWVALPLVVVGLLITSARMIRWRECARALAPLMIGSGAGVILRLPFAEWISSGPPYAHPTQQLETFVYYLRLLLDRLTSPAGAVSIGLVIFLVISNFLIFVHSSRQKRLPLAVLAGMGFIAPVAVIAGAVIVGAVGLRYLQPVFFAPVTVLVLLPGLRTLPAVSERGKKVPHPITVVVGALVLIAGSAGSTLGLHSSVAAVDPSVRCVDEWITTSQQTGAGRFWTIRGPKAYLTDPRQLLQVDGEFNGYTWLTNRADYDQTAVSFVLSDDSAISPSLSADITALPHSIIHCGRYTIADYHRNVLTIGPLNAIEAK